MSLKFSMKEVVDIVEQVVQSESEIETIKELLAQARTVKKEYTHKTLE